jgi:hypothetical protein
VVCENPAAAAGILTLGNSFEKPFVNRRLEVQFLSPAPYPPSVEQLRAQALRFLASIGTLFALNHYSNMNHQRSALTPLVVK